MTPFATAAEDLSVTAVRFWSLGDVTRIAIETTGPFTFRPDRLHNPERAFYDLRGAKPAMNKKGVYSIPVNDSRLKQIRVAETQPSVTRIVLDLEEGSFELTTSQLSVPDRLMIEVRSKSDAPGPVTLSSTGMRRIPKGTDEPAAPEKKQEPPVLAAKNEPAHSPIPEPKVATPPPSKPVSAAIAKPERVPFEPPVLTSKPGPIKASPLAGLESPPSNSEPSDGASSPRPAKRNSTGDRSLTRALGLKLRRVVIDPGHGGKDHGTTGPSGLTEKEVVLDVSKRLGALIEENLGSEVIYTRDSDKFITLEDRPGLANSKKADLFLSIHVNSSPVRTAAGTETYYLSFSTARDALELAARENAASQRSIGELKEILQKIALREKLTESREFAAKVQTSLNQLTTSTIPVKPGVKRDRGVKRAPLIVLIGAQMPSILTEIGFVTNAKEEAMLRKPEYRQKIAEAILKGLEQYAESLSHFEVAQTGKRTGTE